MAGSLVAAAEAARRFVSPAQCEEAEDIEVKEVDFIVIGGGSSGCALSVRLSERLPKCQTLLLEAGTHDNVPEIQTAVDYFGKAERIFGSDRDWIFASEPQEELELDGKHRGLYWPRGKVLGGCSSFNTMVWMRGDPADFQVRGRGKERRRARGMCV